MSTPLKDRLLRAETLAAAGIVVVAAGFLVPAAALPPMSALLPATMLIALIVLALALLISDQRKASKGEAAEQVTHSPKRVAGAFLLVVAYAVAVDFVGFYPSTIVSVPLVAWIFGFRNPAGLALATAITVGAIFVIFSLAMSQSFPAGRLWTL
ncbi:tripartite tricarboxylate transporter TctB family protein [Mangrovicoccus ximenensis]|uniref:tripartite tricarboxylate transporter TctB family protein n=1 Tax=Mangrovicoccus ximenensis TaxID=1911570 RepID=UPI000D37517F|nr:tripartite tricarboxylate transporter TctB family protein [Mangrovicoccus ximenensis]